ncbi:BURP domain-containing protein USPL1 [Citrus sinensis]|uniref:BURP domain-containing protein USPL1 n=1 Tax=Citrus sinensis TaxID=2711 RepID=A0ACB8II68_CITSI|nr:BURP domain-containing protein USPL1 [Citrus sinensis]
MGLRFSAWNLLLSLLFLCAPVLSENLHDSHSIPSHMNHMDPSTMVFFTLKDLKIGETMPIYFRKRDPSAYPQALPREEADSIPFSLKQLPYLLQFFSFSDDSPLAKAMEGTLNHCEVPPIEGETKICATSLESMLDFVHGTFGLETKFQVLSTKFLAKSATIFQNYTILQVPKPMVAPKMVACHIMPYPYAIFYCHSQMTENKLFGVSLGGDNGDRVEAVAVCHMDTSHWSRDHASFRVLGIEPGSSHVCHFFQADNIVYIPAPTYHD